MNVWNEADRLAETLVRHFNTQTQADIGDGINLTKHRWHANGMHGELENDNLHVWADKYDTARRHLCTFDPLGNDKLKFLDASGNVTRVDERCIDTATMALSRTFRTDYLVDADNRTTVEIKDPLGLDLQTNLTLGPRGETLIVQDASANQVHSLYDEALRKVAEAVLLNGNLVPDFTNHSAPDQSLTTWDLNLDGQPESMADPRNNSYASQWNDRLEMELKTNPDATTVNPEYSLAGYMKSSTDEKGTQLNYDVSKNLQVQGYTVAVLGTDTAGLAQGGTMAGVISRNGLGEVIGGSACRQLSRYPIPAQESAL